MRERGANWVLDAPEIQGETSEGVKEVEMEEIE